MSACSLWSGIIYLYPAEEGIIPCWGWCASAALQMMVAAIHVTPMHGAMQDGAVQGQESNSVILEGPFQLSLFWDSPSAASGTFLWRLNQHSSACLPLPAFMSWPESANPITELFSCRMWGKISSLQSQQCQCWKGKNPVTGLLEVSGLYFSVWDEVVALCPWPSLMREETHIKRLQLSG